MRDTICPVPHIFNDIRLKRGEQDMLCVRDQDDPSWIDGVTLHPSNSTDNQHSYLHPSFVFRVLDTSFVIYFFFVVPLLPLREEMFKDAWLYLGHQLTARLLRFNCCFFFGPERSCRCPVVVSLCVWYRSSSARRWRCAMLSLPEKIHDRLDGFFRRARAGGRRQRFVGVVLALNSRSNEPR